jgi:hypothetical protein
MTMHLMSPAFTTTGKKKGKQKFKSAEAAAKARKNAESWKQLLEKWDVKPERKTKRMVSKATKLDPVVSTSFVYNPERDTSNIASMDTGIGIAPKKDIPQYTGDEMIGIGQLHKSNSVPVFRKEDAEDQAKMRRN